MNSIKELTDLKEDEDLTKGFIQLISNPNNSIMKINNDNANDTDRFVILYGPMADYNKETISDIQIQNDNFVHGIWDITFAINYDKHLCIGGFGNINLPDEIYNPAVNDLFQYADAVIPESDDYEKNILLKIPDIDKYIITT